LVGQWAGRVLIAPAKSTARLRLVDGPGLTVEISFPLAAQGMEKA
jgi:hypothetical protein